MCLWKVDNEEGIDGDSSAMRGVLSNDPIPISSVAHTGDVTGLEVCQIVTMYGARSIPYRLTLSTLTP